MLSSARELLDQAYQDLELSQSTSLLSTSIVNELDDESYLNKGEWLYLAKRVGAEKLFFVDNNPVIVFSVDDSGSLEDKWFLFNKVWSMARPRLLFLSSNGELAVYDLERPCSTLEEWKRLDPLVIVKNTNEVLLKLKSFHRDEIESGRLFQEKRFGKIGQRADKTLINDLKIVRKALINNSLTTQLTHSLIGRSIFIRYLEDRGIITKEYFQAIARKNQLWSKILGEQEALNANGSTKGAIYYKVLTNKDFTYAFFSQLSEDFNGDMFATLSEEYESVSQVHLNLLKGFLCGNTESQQKLFLWIYDFGVVPIELISNIYEEFYHAEISGDDLKGTHYTPAALVELTLSKLLTTKVLEGKPRVLDPACGSAIFLVEAYKRIVRFNRCKKGEDLTGEELKVILKDQIAGIEVNKEAVGIAAFSLYLALLHYQEPKDILAQIHRGNHLPVLIYNSRSTENYSFNILLNANAFAIEEKIVDPIDQKMFSDGCADIVVGNPPWGSPAKSEVEGRQLSKKAINWCKNKGLPVGDEERSQAFIWLSMFLLKKGGLCGLLISTGIFYKGQQKSKNFRNRWLSNITLLEVINFSHVRDIFFQSGTGQAISPFAAIFFENKPYSIGTMFRYWSVKKDVRVLALKTVTLQKIDFKWLSQSEVKEDERFWKIFWWGSKQDAGLIRYLDSYPKISEYTITGQGFTKGLGEARYSAEFIENYKILDINDFDKFNEDDSSILLSPPNKVKSRGNENLYNGSRILMKMGVQQKGDIKGVMAARIFKTPFAFNSSIIGIKPNDSDMEVVIWAILHSSLFRYYFFLTGRKWGQWHFEIQLQDLRTLPFSVPNNKKLLTRFKEIYKSSLKQSVQPKKRKPDLFDLFPSPDSNKSLDIFKEIDEAVFELFDLSQADKELVEDMCNIGIDFFYSSTESIASKNLNSVSGKLTGTFNSLSKFKYDYNLRPIEGYLINFLKIWNDRLENKGTFYYQIFGIKAPFLAIVFTAFGTNEKFEESKNKKEWTETLKEIGENLTQQYHTDKINIEGMARIVIGPHIIIIKRNEFRLWTRSIASEDAEATMVNLLNLTNN